MEKSDTISESIKGGDNIGRETQTTVIDFQGLSFKKREIQVADTTVWKTAFDTKSETYTNRQPSKREAGDSDLSNIVISAVGSFYEEWVSVVNVPSQIIEINNLEVIMECLDLESNDIQIRTFARHNFPKQIAISDNFLVTIYSGVGKINIEFERDHTRRFFSATSGILEQAKKVNWGKHKL